MIKVENIDIDDIACEYGLDTICVYDYHNKPMLALTGFTNIDEANEIADKYGMEFITASKHKDADRFKIQYHKGKQLSHALYRDDEDLMSEYENHNLGWILREAPSREKMLDMLLEAIENLDGYNEGKVDTETLEELWNNAERTLKEAIYNLPDGRALLVSNTLEIIDKVETDNLFEYTDDNYHRIVLALIESNILMS